MRAIFIATGACVTLITFVAAERLHSSMNASAETERQALVTALVDKQVAAAEAGFVADTAKLEAQRNEAEVKVNRLDGLVTELAAERDVLQAELDAERDNTTATAKKLVEIEALHSGMAERVELQLASLSEKDGELDALRIQVAEFQDNIEKDVEQGDADAKLVAEVASLSEQLLDRDVTIASLENAVAQSTALQKQTTGFNAAIKHELAAAKAQIEELQKTAPADAAQTEDVVAKLSDTLRQRDTVIAELEAKISEQAALGNVSTSEVQATDEPAQDVVTLTAQIAELESSVATQAKTISTLRMGFEDDKATATQMADACIERANKIFEISQIKFATSTAAISEDSITTLDHLRDLAIGCENEEMFIEIGGHTDSFGAEADNQVLSEARADSVRDFLVARGIPEDTMVAVGFGETQPIATNDTAVGRAQNRRISFVWRMHEQSNDNTDQ